MNETSDASTLTTDHPAEAVLRRDERVTDEAAAESVEEPQTEDVTEAPAPTVPEPEKTTRMNHPYSGPRPGFKPDDTRDLPDGTEIWYKGRLGQVVAQDRSERYVRIQLDGESTTYGKCKSQVYARSEISDWLAEKGNEVLVDKAGAEPAV